MLGLVSKRVFGLALLALCYGAIPVYAQPVRVDSNTQPSQALSVRCVDITGTVFEACGGSGGGGSSDLVVFASLTSTVCPGSGCLTLQLTQPTSTVLIDIAGPVGGRVNFRYSTDGTTYADLYCNQLVAGTTGPIRKVDSFTTAVHCSVAGIKYVQVWQTIYFSGNADVTIHATIGALEPISDSFLLTDIDAQLNSIASAPGTAGLNNIVSIGGGTVTGTPGQLDVNCISGCASPPATPDLGAFTAGVTNATNIAGVYNEGLASVASGKSAVPRINEHRALHTVLYDSTDVLLGDNSLGRPMDVLVTNTLGIPVTQGSGAGSVSSPWFVGVTDGVNLAHVTPASTAAVAADQALVTRTVQLPTALAANGGLKIEGVASGIAVPVSGSFFQATQPVSGTFWQATQPVSGTFWQTNQQVVGAAASSATKAGNPIQVGGVYNNPQPTVASGQVVEAQSSIRGAQIVATGADVFTVSLSALSHIITDATSTTAVTSNTASTNLAQVSGSSASGASKAGNPIQTSGVFNTTQPTVTTGQTVESQSTARGAQIVATGVDAFVLGTGANTIGALTANQTVDLNRVGGTTIATGGLAGIIGIGGGTANNATLTNPIVIGGEAIAQGSQPTAATAGNLRRFLATTEGALFVQEGNSNRFSCFLQAVTVTTQCRLAPSAGLRNYVTSVSMSNQAATVQTLDIVFGTGTDCVTGTTALTHKWQFGTNATTTSPQDVTVSFTTPLVPTAANAICVRPSAATAFGVTITGYVAP